MKQRINGDATPPSRGDMTETENMRIDHSAVEQRAEKELDEILEPLIELLNERYEESGCCEPFALIEVTGGQMYKVESPYPDGVIIELPSRLRNYPTLTSALATLLQRSGSDDLWFDQDGEDDPYRTPLRFCLVKKLIWMPSDGGFSEGVHLMVDAMDFDAEAAEEQVVLLVNYLEYKKNLVELSAEDLLMF